MADQNITALPVATTPESLDQLLLVGTTEEKLIDYDKLADAILGKIASKNFALDQGNKTLLAALNELNSKVKWSNLVEQYGGENIYKDIFKDALSAAPVGSEYTFAVNIKSVESNCVVKFYKRDSSSGKMIVFRYNGITIVDGTPSALLTYSISGTS